MGEFRTVTVLFICIHSINFQTTRDYPLPSNKPANIPPFLAEAFPRNKLLTSQSSLNSAIAQFANKHKLASRRNSNADDASAINANANANAGAGAGDDASVEFSKRWRRGSNSNTDDATNVGDPNTLTLDTNALVEGPTLTLASSPSFSSPLSSSPSLSQSSSVHRLCVSYAEGLDAYVDSARARANTLHSSMSYDATDIATKLQLAVTTIQTELLTLEGDVNKLVADDKGLIAIAVFGLPPMYVCIYLILLTFIYFLQFRSHEDDPLRGVLAAISIRNQLLALNMECSIGVRYHYT